MCHAFLLSQLPPEVHIEAAAAAGRGQSSGMEVDKGEQLCLAACSGQLCSAICIVVASIQECSRFAATKKQY